MTQEDKQLLIKDLCARLPYGVKCLADGKYLGVLSGASIGDIYKVFFFKGIDPSFNIEEIKPFLRPMLSMTEAETEKYHSFCEFDDGDYTGYPMWFNTIESFEYLYSIHIDVWNFIGKGLALEAPEGMYNK